MPIPSPSRCRAVFEEVADLRPDARGDLLDRACAGDETLRLQVQRLLNAHDAMGPFLEVPPVWNASEPDPRWVGQYEIVRKLGEGGMGRVYLGNPGPVAVKVIRRDLDAGLVLRRLHRERDMLSRLAHPNIARLIDGGTTEDGSPYLVLGYVDGTPLDDFCRHRRLALRERLELFRSVCEAVSYAHGQLVLHRDLKPANILVTETGVPVVLDFGLAKLARTSLEVALDSTTTGHRLLTPEYASPEQVSGLRVTPAADVYALGLVLYELLADVRPHRFITWSMTEILDVICNSKAVPPSHALSRVENASTTWPVHAGELRGGLDFIVMKAIAKVPAKRYSHVAEFGDDLQRHLEGRPIPGCETTT